MHAIGDFFWSILWVFFIASAIQPLLQQRYLETTRRRRIARFERRRGSRVIVMVHRQETMRLLGFPIVRYIDINDSEDVLRAIRMTARDVPIDLVLHTPGGLVLAALQIAWALRQHPAKVTAFVPHYAMSGGTLDLPGGERNRNVASCGAWPGRSADWRISGGFPPQGG